MTKAPSADKNNHFRFGRHAEKNDDLRVGRQALAFVLPAYPHATRRKLAPHCCTSMLASDENVGQHLFNWERSKDVTINYSNSKRKTPKLVIDSNENIRDTNTKH